MGKASFFAELKRRNVLRAAAFYASACWLLIQVAAQLFPIFQVPDWVLKWIVLAAFLGSPFAMAFAWFYEFTSEGVKAESELESDTTVIRYTGRKLDRWIIAVLSLAVVLLLANTFVLHKAADEVVAIPDKSIAVLPFDNLSVDKENGYFATGMQDEILTRLAGIHDLKVISRKSTAQYESHPENLKTVSQQLSVATVLEGSVQKSGNQAHINVQLVDARNDSQLWAQSYDRELKDIFGVQRDVSEKVADALKAQLLPAESARIASIPTKNTEAYDLYLRAGEHFDRGDDQNVLVAREMPLAIGLYQKALEKDPGFALAAAGLGQSHMRLYWFGPDRTPERLASAKTAADQALALSPNLGEGHVALAMYHYWGHRDYAQALQQLELARKSMPNSAYVEFVTAAVARRQGRFDDAVAGFERAVVLDPRSASTLQDLALTYSRMRRFADADQAYARAAAATKNPSDELVTRALMNTVPWKGELEPLRAALATLTPGTDDYIGNARNFYMLQWWSRDFAAAAKTAETDAAEYWVNLDNVALPRRLYLALATAAAGDNAKAKSLFTELRPQLQAALQQRPDDPDLHLALGFVDAGLGLKDEALAEGTKATELLPVGRDAITGPAYLAWLAKLEARLGENDKAIDALGRLLAMRAAVVASPALLKLDPFWDPLRKDPRFQKMVSGSAASAASNASPRSGR